MAEEKKNLRLGMKMYGPLELLNGFEIPSENWTALRFTGFKQEKQGVTVYEGTPEEVYYEPTFSWIGTIVGHRKGDDKETGNFYLRVRIIGEQDVGINVRLARANLFMGLEQFQEFSNCSCLVGKPCERHSRVYAESQAT